MDCIPADGLKSREPYRRARPSSVVPLPTFPILRAGTQSPKGNPARKKGSFEKLHFSLTRGLAQVSHWRKYKSGDLPFAVRSSVNLVRERDPIAGATAARGIRRGSTVMSVTATTGREPGAEGSLGRKGVWGGRESGAREPGAEWSLGRKGALGGPTDRRGFQPALAPN